jgi:hypothetical protein
VARTPEEKILLLSNNLFRHKLQSCPARSESLNREPTLPNKLRGSRQFLTRPEVKYLERRIDSQAKPVGLSELHVKISIALRDHHIRGSGPRTLVSCRQRIRIQTGPNKVPDFEDLGARNAKTVCNQLELLGGQFIETPG